MPFWQGVSGEEARQAAIRHHRNSSSKDTSPGTGGCLIWCVALAAAVAAAAGAGFAAKG